MTAAPLIISSPAREKQQQQQRRRRRRRQRGRNIAQRCRPDQPTDLSAYLRGREATRSSLTPMRFSVFLKKKKKSSLGGIHNKHNDKTKTLSFFLVAAAAFVPPAFLPLSLSVSLLPPQKKRQPHTKKRVEWKQQNCLDIWPELAHALITLNTTIDPACLRHLDRAREENITYL